MPRRVLVFFGLNKRNKMDLEKMSRSELASLRNRANELLAVEDQFPWEKDPEFISIIEEYDNIFEPIDFNVTFTDTVGCSLSGPDLATFEIDWGYQLESSNLINSKEVKKIMTKLTSRLQKVTARINKFEKKFKIDLKEHGYDSLFAYIESKC